MVLLVHSHEGHLQYLQSLESDMADDNQALATASSLEDEYEAATCELGIRYPSLQAIYAEKLKKQSIQVNIII